MYHGKNEKKKKKRMGMMYGGERKPMMGGGMNEMKRNPSMHGGVPHNNMDRIGMAMGGAMDVQDPN